MNEDYLYRIENILSTIVDCFDMDDEGKYTLREDAEDEISGAIAQADLILSIVYPDEQE